MKMFIPGKAYGAYQEFADTTREVPHQFGPRAPATDRKIAATKRAKKVPVTLPRLRFMEGSGQ